LTAVIQGTADADVKGQLTQTEISKSIDFCFRAFAHVPVEEKEALIEKLKSLGLDDPSADDLKTKEAIEELEKTLSPEELKIMDTIRARRMVRAEDSLNIDNYSLDVINGMAPNLERGNLTLVKKGQATKVNYTGPDMLSLLNGEAKPHKAATKEEEVHNVKVSEIEIAVTA
jgi:flavine halogenase